MAVLAAVAGAGVGALMTLVVKAMLDRRVESRNARREFYVELLTLLVGRRRVMERVSFAPTEAMPDDIADDRVDRFDARLMIDATTQVRDLATGCLRLLARFNASQAMQAPVDVDDHGFYRYRFDRVRGTNGETTDLVMRLALGEVYDAYGKAVDALADRIRRELHGPRG